MPLDSKIQMKKTSATGATGCKQPGKKKAKEREFSVERLHISPLEVNPPVATSWFTITARQARQRSAAWCSALRSESFDSNPLRIPPPDSHPKVGDENALYDLT
ncbi:hypothetical protein AVEN_195309-1 [Araneus ventricosus]|uniref:Uncharacterized protein n=1 Tax=Araneus ventricosus TaxID=182803 RepID=A0A4Y2IC45_ARAVE|nr:hypothetical protein AVEN_195309-1 [Araneus ventricosus]